MRVRVDGFNAGFAASHVPELDRTVVAAGHQIPAPNRNKKEPNTKSEDHAGINSLLADRPRLVGIVVDVADAQWVRVLEPEKINE